MNGNTVGSTATYSCISADYMLVGPQTRECTANAGWSEQDSLCSKLKLGSAIVQYIINFMVTTFRAQV